MGRQRGGDRNAEGRRRFSGRASAAAPAWAKTTEGARARPPGGTEDAAGGTQLPFDRRFTHHKAYVGDVRLHFVRGGQGDPLILLHGWPATWYEWRRVMPALAARHDVVAVDIRGLGDSSRPAAGYDKETAAADIAGLARLLGLGKVDLVGHDIGGQIAFAFARNHADLLGRVAILDIAIPGLHEWEASQLWHFAFQGTPDVPETLVTGREREYLGYFYAGEAYNPSAFTRGDIDEFLRTYAQPGALRAGFAYYRAFKQDAADNKRWADGGGKLSSPVLWLGGMSALNQPCGGGPEPAGTGGLLGRQLAAVATDLRGEELPGCGHWMSTECPEVVSRKLLDFLEAGARANPRQSP